MNTPPPLKDQEHAELLVLYQVTTQDLTFFKSQQWALTNYGLLALAAIVGVRQLSQVKITPCVATLLCAVAVFLTVLTAWLLLRLHGSIEERRGRLERIYARFSDEFRTARGMKRSVSAWEIVLPLFGLLALALWLTVWLLFAGIQ